MRLFVINLPEHQDRRLSSEQKLRSLGLSFEFFDATSGETAFRDGVFSAYDDDEFLLNTGREVAMGEIGCFASHRALWSMCCRLNEPIMIMEDDFDLLDGFIDAVRSAEELTAELGFLRLQTDLSARMHPVLSSRRFIVSRFTKAPHSTMCYSISPIVARRFIEASRKFDAPVDVFIRKFWEHRQPLYALKPYTVAPSVMSVDTTIRGRGKNRKKFKIAVRRFLRKGRWHWQRLLFNIDYRYVSAPDLKFALAKRRAGAASPEVSAETG